MTKVAIIHSADSPYIEGFFAGEAGCLTYYKPYIFSKESGSGENFSHLHVQVDPQLKELQKGLRRRQFQLLFVGDDRAGFKALSWKSRWQVPVVAFLGGCVKPSSGKMRKNKKQLKRLFSIADGILVPCQAMKEEWIKAGCPEEKLMVHDRGMDPEKTEAELNREKQVRQLEQWFDQIIRDFEEKRDRPFFSVIIPAFNRERYIGNAIRSVLQQTCDDFEIIVVDDGSTDRTKKAVKAFGDKVKYIYQKNQGPSAARNTGILHAKGKFIVFLDSDDRFFPNKLEENKRFLEKHPVCKFLYSWYYEKRDGAGKRRIQKTKSYKDLQKFRYRLYRRDFTIRTSTAVIHRSCFDKVGLFGKNYRYSQDWDMWLRLAKYFLGYCQKVPLVQYRRHKRVKNPIQARRYHEQIRRTARRLYRWDAGKLNRLKKIFGWKKRIKIRNQKAKRFSAYPHLRRRS